MMYKRVDFFIEDMNDMGVAIKKLVKTARKRHKEHIGIIFYFHRPITECIIQAIRKGF